MHWRLWGEWNAWEDGQLTGGSPGLDPNLGVASALHPLQGSDAPPKMCLYLGSIKGHSRALYALASTPSSRSCFHYGYSLILSYLAILLSFFILHISVNLPACMRDYQSSEILSDMTRTLVVMHTRRTFYPNTTPGSRNHQNEKHAPMHKQTHP